MAASHFTFRVYYEDTDAGGVVYYANYLKFAERARTEALRAAGMEQTRLRDEHDALFVVKRASIDYLRSARLDDRLTIHTHLTDSGAASLTLKQSISRGAERVAEIEVTLAVIDTSFRPKRLSAPLRDALFKAFG